MGTSWWSTEVGLPANLLNTALAKSLRQAGVVGVLRAPDADRAVQAGRAAVRGGLRVLEVTFTTPNAAEVLRQLRGARPDVLLGAGTVMNAEQAAAAVRSGAQFLISPHLDEDLLNAAHRLGVPYLPGVLTPSEVTRALRLGAEIVKLFPIGSSGGTAYLRDLLGPFPELPVLVTGGVAPGEVGAYLASGALAVGLGSFLFPRSALHSGNWAEVERATRAALTQAGVTV